MLWGLVFISLGFFYFLTVRASTARYLGSRFPDGLLQ